jgi:hypothetical protein
MSFKSRRELHAGSIEILTLSSASTPIRSPAGARQGGPQRAAPPRRPASHPGAAGHRAQAVTFRTRAISALHAVVTSAADGLRERLRTLPLGQLLQTSAGLRDSSRRSVEESATVLAMLSNEEYLKKLISSASEGGVTVEAAAEGLQFFIVKGGGEGFLPGRYRRIDASSVTRKDKRFDDNDLIVVFDEKGKLISSTLVQRSCSGLSLFRARSRRKRQTRLITRWTTALSRSTRTRISTSSTSGSTSTTRSVTTDRADRRPYMALLDEPSGECVQLEELAGGHRCCTFGCTGRKVPQPSRGKPSLTRGGAKGTRTPNPLLAR